jgi:hypothetical protein
VFAAAGKSYVKTTVACSAIVPAALLSAFGAVHVHWLPRVLAILIATLSTLVALGAGTLASACAIVLVRYRRFIHGGRDLFLELNRSRDATAIRSGAAPRVWPFRRVLAHQLLGHDLVVGDLVEIRPWDEIRATLDERGCLEQLPFMPEMLGMCGQRAYVFRCLHRLFDYRKTRQMRHMEGTVLLVGGVCNGASHGGCEAACYTIWKSAWLRRIEPSEARSEPVRRPGPPNPDTAVLQFGTTAPRYLCQLTQLQAASRPIDEWNAINTLRPLVAGNVTPAAFLVGWLTYLFNIIQHLRHGVTFPIFEPAAEATAREDILFDTGDRVMVRSSAEIRSTLDDQLMHRGMWFEPDMFKYCGGHYRVRSRVKQVIDIVSGEMRTIKTPSYLLDDVRFSGERQLFNAQHEPLFWRGVWLQRDRD